MATDVKNIAATAAVAEGVIRHMSEALDEPAIGANQLRLLLSLRIHGELPQQDLSEFAGVERSAISRNIAKLGQGEKPLIKAGPNLVESYEDIHNRRLKNVRLTPKGKAFVDDACAKVIQFLPSSGR